MDMKLPFLPKASAIALDIRLGHNGGRGSATLSIKEEGNCVQLDDFLQVEVLARPSLRTATQIFLREHCGNPHGVSFIAARGKLIAELLAHSGQPMSFGDLVARTKTALDKSELKCIGVLDARELARSLCIPAVGLC